jgi:AAA domain
MSKERFVAVAETLTRGLLREAIGYRVEQAIPYLKGTVGFMVEAPLLWIRYSRFPILFVACDRTESDVLATIVRQLEIARATEFFALLIVVPPRDGASGREADELRQIVADSVYRHDFVVLDREHLASIIARNSSKRLIEIVLEQGTELSTLSPYVVRGPVPGSMFFGRESEIKRISQTILRGNHAVVGGRRIGKSSVLLRLKRLLGDDPRYRPIYLDCEARFDYEGFFDGLADHADRPASGDPLQFQRIASALREQDRLPVFLLDEIDELLAYDADRRPSGQLFKAFRAASHEGICRFVFSGSRTLHHHLGDANSPFFNFCETVVLGRLQERSVAEIIRKPMQQLGVELPDEEQLVLRLIELTSCHPNIAQWLCDRLIRSSVGRRITTAALEDLATTPEFHEYYVGTAWSDATSIEKLITLLIEDHRFDEESVRQKLIDCGLPLDPRLIRQSLDVLQLYSVIERDGSHYRFGMSQYPRIVRESGVAAAQLDFLAAEVLKQCS